MVKFTATVKNILPVERGTSRSGNPWQKGIIIVETTGQYPKVIALTLFNRALENVRVQLGLMYDFEADIESREYNGRWYTEVTAFRATQYATQYSGYQASPSQYGNEPPC